MDTIKGKVNKIILGLTSVGLLILLIFPASLSANHFRYGTMSWDLVDNDTIRLKMQNGWTAHHGGFRVESSYLAGNGGVWVPGYISSIKLNYQTISWSGGSPSTSLIDFKIMSRDNTTATPDSDCTANCIGSTYSKMGEYSSGTWTNGITHDYDNGTYVVWWSGGNRSAVKNS